MGKSPVKIAVSTTKGAYLLSSDENRKDWNSVGPFLAEESVNNVTSDRSGKLFASTLTEGVFSSSDSGKTWVPSSRGLLVKKVWTVEADKHEDGVLYAGTHYGHLFRSLDSGRTWSEVAGLHNAPLRDTWGVDWAMGTIGLALHTVKSDPAKKGRLFVVSSGGGPYRSDDSGETWKLLKDGVAESCPVGAKDFYGVNAEKSDSERLKEHLDSVHKCTHKLAISTANPGLVYQQNHCGVFSSTDSGDSWKDISPSPDVRHGFPIALTEKGGSSLFVVPAYQGKCKEHNSCIQGQLEVNRTGDGGKTWTRLSNGLPNGVHTVALRDSMATDDLDNPGVYFGTTTGEVYCSTDNGDNWRRVTGNLGRVQGVSVLAS